jgi:hypothetical protein
LPPERLPKEQQRGEQNEPAQLQQQPEQGSQPPRPTQQQSATQNPKIVLKPQRSIPHSFYKELNKSCAAAETLNASGQSISAIIKAQAETWMKTGRVTAAHEGRWDGFFICMCTTMFRRDDSWKNAFPLQLAVALMYAPRVKIFLVTFAEDEDAWAHVFKHAQWALDLGILYLASSGNKSGEVVPPSARQRYWHASQCKNAAHIFAAQEVQKQGIAAENVLLVNLDADNIMPPEYVEQLLAGFQAETQRVIMAGLSPKLVPLRPILGRSAAGGLTGRIGISLPDFARLGGYDEEPKTYGTGYQDIDLLLRAKAMILKYTNESQKLLLRKDAQVYRLPCEAGAAFKNENDILVAEDRGSSKIKNLDPAVVKALKTWGRINQANVAQLRQKLERGLIGRNGASSKPDLRLSASWHVGNLFALRLGAAFYRHPSPEVPWDGALLRAHLQQQLQQQASQGTSSSSVGSAAELSCGHSRQSLQQGCVVCEAYVKHMDANTARLAAALPPSSSVGSATEPVGSSSSSTTTSKARPTARISQPEPSTGAPPRAKARPLQKQTTFDLVSWLLIYIFHVARTCRYFTHTFD